MKFGRQVSSPHLRTEIIAESQRTGGCRSPGNRLHASLAGKFQTHIFSNMLAACFMRATTTWTTIHPAQQVIHEYMYVDWLFWGKKFRKQRNVPAKQLQGKLWTPGSEKTLPKSQIRLIKIHGSWNNIPWMPANAVLKIIILRTLCQGQAFYYKYGKWGSFNTALFFENLTKGEVRTAHKILERGDRADRMRSPPWKNEAFQSY